MRHLGRVRTSLQSGHQSEGVVSGSEARGQLNEGGKCEGQGESAHGPLGLWSWLTSISDGVYDVYIVTTLRKGVKACGLRAVVVGLSHGESFGCNQSLGIFVGGLHFVSPQKDS